MASKRRFPSLARRLLPDRVSIVVIRYRELVMMNFVLFALGLLTAACDTLVRI